MLPNFHVFTSHHYFYPSVEDDLYFPNFGFHQHKAAPFPFVLLPADVRLLPSAGLSISAHPTAFDRQLCQTSQMIHEPACHILFWKYFQVEVKKQTRSKSQHVLLTQWTNCWADFSWQLRKGSPTPDLHDPANPYHIYMRSLWQSAET